MDIHQGHALKKFNYLCKELDDVYHKIALKSGLSDSAFFILYAVVENGDGCLQKDIAECYSLSRQTINSSVKSLTEKGYITLLPGKGRDKHIQLTLAGRQLVKDRILPVIKMENAAFDEMASEDKQALLRLTEEYIRLLQEKVKQIT